MAFYSLYLLRRLLKQSLHPVTFKTDTLGFRAQPVEILWDCDRARFCLGECDVDIVLTVRGRWRVPPHKLCNESRDRFVFRRLYVDPRIRS